MIAAGFEQLVLSGEVLSISADASISLDHFAAPFCASVSSVEALAESRLFFLLITFKVVCSDLGLGLGH